MSNAATKSAPFAESDAALIMGCPAKAVRARFVALGYVKVCGRCGGSGRYSYNQMDGDRCFGCSGSGKVVLPVTRARAEEAAARTAAGDLDAYFARNEATRAAKAMIAPLLVEATALIKAIGDAYMVASRAGTLGNVLEAPAPVFHAQTMNTAIYYGRQAGHATTVPALMSVSELESALKWGKATPVVVAREIAERVAMLRDLNAAWTAFCAERAVV